jgi:dienelactone hydrolase
MPPPFRRTSPCTARACVSLLLATLVAAASAACAPRVPRDAPGRDAPFRYAAVEPDVRERERQAGERFDRARIDFASPRGGRAPAVLHLPHGDGPFPALLLMHGLPDRPESLRTLGEAYAAAGVVTLALAAPYNRADRPYTSGRLLRAPLFDARDRDELIQTVVDLRRAIDLLQARADVDGTAVGFVGHSYGGSVGALLAAVEPRLAGVVLMVPSNGLVTVANNGFRGLPAATYAELPPDEREAWARSLEDLEADRWIGRAAPDRLLIQAGLRDELVRPEDTNRLADAAPGADLRWYDAGHALSREALREQAEFLGRRLGFDAGAFVAPDSIARER